MLKCIRPDRLNEGVNIYIQNVFGIAVKEETEWESFVNVIQEENTKPVPYILLSTGFDVSYKVDALASELSQSLVSVAMGSPEAKKLAESAIKHGIRTGGWVLIKNAHLDIEWTSGLEKRFNLCDSMIFKLFITFEIHPLIPTNLLRSSRTLVFAPPLGIKASMIESIDLVPKKMLQTGPAEKHRVVFMLIWLHATIVERTRYSPIGWTKDYDFNSSDLEISLSLVDNWLTMTCQGRSNISPDKIPWDALQSLLATTIYGGKIDRPSDQVIMNTLVAQYFNVHIFDSDFNVCDGSSLVIPDGSNFVKFREWVNALGSNQSPNWIGLAVESDILLNTAKGHTLLSKMRIMSHLLMKDKESARMISVDELTSWISLLPKVNADLTKMIQNNSGGKDPLSRFCKNEYEIARDLLKKISGDLMSIKDIQEGKSTALQTRSLISILSQGKIPAEWQRYTISKSTTPFKFISNFSQRVQQTFEMANSKDLKTCSVWIGGLFDAESYLTATRQMTAQESNLPLEHLVLQFNLESPPSKSNESTRTGFKIRGLKIQGANSKMELVESVGLEALEEVSIYWTTEPKLQEINIPVYLNEDRTNVLFSCGVASKHGKHANGDIMKRAVAIIAG